MQTTHVLESGFGIKDPEKFLIQQPDPQTMAEEEQLPPEDPAAGGMPPQMGGMPLPPGQDGAFAPTGGVPPELLAQLQGQMGMELPSL